MQICSNRVSQERAHVEKFLWHFSMLLTYLQRGDCSLTQSIEIGPCSAKKENHVSIACNHPAHERYEHLRSHDLHASRGTPIGQVYVVMKAPLVCVCYLQFTALRMAST
mmetsp:Transcript_28988/g.72282  ORF Transcript_28988/g.72282 Transcript_28988/m.72282 type:complete len:109 (-) Transcript_28988:383-709(-)